MRRSRVYSALHRPALVGGVKLGSSGLYFGLAFGGAFLLGMMLTWWYAPIPPLVVGIYWKAQAYRYQEEPAIDEIMADFDRQVDFYSPWGSGTAIERFFKRSHGFGRYL